MFTGIIEELGKLKSVNWGSKSAVLEVEAKLVLEDIRIGDSINTNGACLTVVSYTSYSFTVDVMAETMRQTSLSNIKAGTLLNLERAMKLSDRLGGHLVSGHIDGLGRINSLYKEDNAVWVDIQADAAVLRYIIPKGSIAINGISLTVAEVGKTSFKVSIIPQTAKETNLLSHRTGDQVNLETDMIGKYIERFVLQGKTDAAGSQVDMNFLRENGFA